MIRSVSFALSIALLVIPCRPTSGIILSHRVGVPSHARSGPVEPGDHLRIAIFELVTPGLTWSEVRGVAKDGTIELPSIGKIKVAGLTPKGIEAAIDQTMLDLFSRGSWRLPKGSSLPAVSVKLVP